MLLTDGQPKFSIRYGATRRPAKEPTCKPEKMKPVARALSLCLQPLATRSVADTGATPSPSPTRTLQASIPAAQHCICIGATPLANLLHGFRVHLSMEPFCAHRAILEVALCPEVGLERVPTAAQMCILSRSAASLPEIYCQSGYGRHDRSGHRRCISIEDEEHAGKGDNEINDLILAYIIAVGTACRTEQDKMTVSAQYTEMDVWRQPGIL